MEPSQAPIGDALSSLQGRLAEGLAFSTIKAYLAAISACHHGLGGRAFGAHPLFAPFMKGVRRATTTDKSLFPSWDLAVVLSGIESASL